MCVTWSPQEHVQEAKRPDFDDILLHKRLWGRLTCENTVRRVMLSFLFFFEKKTNYIQAECG